MIVFVVSCPLDHSFSLQHLFWGFKCCNLLNQNAIWSSTINKIWNILILPLFQLFVLLSLLVYFIKNVSFPFFGNSLVLTFHKTCIFSLRWHDSKVLFIFLNSASSQNQQMNWNGVSSFFNFLQSPIEQLPIYITKRVNNEIFWLLIELSL